MEHWQDFLQTFQSQFNRLEGVLCLHSVLG